MGRKMLSLVKYLSSALSACCSLGGAALLPNFQRSMVLLMLLSTLWQGSESFHGSVKLSANTVRTKYGLLRGIVVRSSPLVEAYLGIPYASPPVGSLRYMAPITPSAWKNVRNADRFSSVCPQTVPIPPNGPEALLEVPRARLAQLRRLLPLLRNQSEDCLYLNVYVPYENRRPQQTDFYSEDNKDAIANRSRKLPTVLFIHGESYEWSSGNPYDGSELAAKGNVIVVTVNFRLGIFGFLKTGGKESAQGNFGLMDLVAGLHWLKENLPAFGGDPQSITILGHGAGAALSNILLVSPVASDLLQRAVLVSGSAISPWAIQKNPLYVKRRVAEQTGCHGDMLYDDLAPCLRTKSVQELLEVKIDHPRFLVGFAPFVDGTVIAPNTDPIRALTLPLGSSIVSTSGIEFANFPKRDLIFCLTSVESYLDLSAQDLEFGFNETRRDRILRTFVRNNFHYHLNEIFAVLKNEYTDWEKAIRNPLSSRDATLAFLSDGHTASALVKLAYLHSLRGGRSYFLHFKHKTVEEEYPQRTGSVRGEDVPFWLGLPISPLFPHNYTTQEKQISNLMLRYLANFAKTGNPNQPMEAESTFATQHHRKEHSPKTSSDGFSALSSQSKDNILQQQQHKSFTNSSQTHINVKRFAVSAKRNDLLYKVTNFTVTQIRPQGKSSLEATENAREALKLAIIYNQHRSKAMKDKRSSYKRRLRSNDETGGNVDDEHLPFWDAFDVVNQLYLELGNKAAVQSHYRGHKLSMWLNLIPQLHRHSSINDQSMRHHQFTDEANSRDLYEGSVRPPLLTKPNDEEDNVIIKIQKTTVLEKVSNSTHKTSENNAYVITATTECGTETTAYITDVGSAAASFPMDNRTLLEPHKELATASTGLIGNLEVLRRLGGKQFQSYTTALVATVAVGCFLLVLNVLIFAGIYHQREKRARYNKTKEELKDDDNCGIKNSSLIKLNTVGQTLDGDNDRHYSGKNIVVFGEYNCYDEKTLHGREEKLIVELPLHTTQMLDPSWTCSTSTLDLQRTKQNTQAAPTTTIPSMPEKMGKHLHDGHSNQEMKIGHPIPTFLDEMGLHSNGSFFGDNNTANVNQFDYAVQSSDQMCFKAIEEAVRASSEDVVHVADDDDDIPEPPPPPKMFQSNHQSGGGILRQAGSSSLSTSSGKKRVHIQEISV